MAVRATGPDVSRWQGSVDWKRVHRAGAAFAVVKATEGLDFVDPTFTPGRYRQMHQAGLICSAYHFARPQPGRTGKQEAQHFLKVVKAAGYGQHGDMPLVLDIESTKLNPVGTQAFIRAFADEVLAQTGARPIIYTSPSFWTTRVGNPTSNFGCLLWIAHYGVKSPTVPRAWKGWTLWQHTQSGHHAGINGACDLNLYNGTYREMRAQLMDRGIVHHRPKPKPKPSKKPTKKPPPAAGHYPKGLPAAYRVLWDRPWQDKAAHDKGFRRWLDDHGYLTPHFRLSEARCKDGSPVPKALNAACRNHAFNLEKLRHALGDRPLPIISWYRSPAYNRKIGGASQSKHMGAIATDHSREWVNAVGRTQVLNTANGIFRNGGLGVYPWGAVHVDTRGARARWSSW
jgi:GH25 family lysozyme M1 (1,4-beta-N-acetylmuramidase)